MTREEILQMDERELYRRLVIFVSGDPKEIETMIKTEADKILAQDCEDQLDTALWYCYQAEEKIISQGLGEKWAINLDVIVCNPQIEDVVNWNSYEIIQMIAHAHPKQRAQAVLLTVEEKDDECSKV